MSTAPDDDLIKLAVARSFDALQSMEMMSPDEAGAAAANGAFRRTLDAETARRARRRSPAKAGSGHRDAAEVKPEERNPAVQAGGDLENGARTNT